MDSKLNPWWLVLIAATLSAAAFFFGTGLHPLWFMTWLAPLPVLLIAPHVTRWQVVAASLLGYCAGSLNMWHYYRQLVPPVVLLLSIVGPGIMLAVSVLPGVAWFTPRVRAFEVERKLVSPEYEAVIE